MGKGTDKLYITHSEWASEDAFSASAGSGTSKPKVPGANFRRLPFNYCAVSLQPFSHPVCTSEGIIFDLTNILPWIKKHGTNPVDGKPLKSSELTKLNFAKNEDGEYVDPVTYKAFTNNSHIVALQNTGNVFAWDTIERLNIKAKNWNDLVSDDEFTRKDIITLQDPQNLGTRDLSSFKYIKEGTSTLTDEQQAERNDPIKNLNMDAMGSSAKVLRAKEAVAKARAERAAGNDPNKPANGKAMTSTGNSTTADGKTVASYVQQKKTPYNAALHTTGQAAASFTSTGLTPHTSGELAILTDEEYLLHPRRVKDKGYVSMRTTQGALTIELYPEWAPKAVWNFIKLAKTGYYNNIDFHRNIKNFMIQGGDPTGTGRGGKSIWGGTFADEWMQSPLRHDGRGVLSMANKGRDTNTSQFFIAYRAVSHLDRKHTIFGRVLLDEGSSGETLKRLEAVKTEEKDVPAEDCRIEELTILVDPFEEFMKKDNATRKDTREAQDAGEKDDEQTTWTGKRLRADGKPEAASGDTSAVGKYLSAAPSTKKSLDEDEDEIIEEITEEWEAPLEPPTKKRKGGGFGNFDNW